MKQFKIYSVTTTNQFQQNLPYKLNQTSLTGPTGPVGPQGPVGPTGSFNNIYSIETLDSQETNIITTDKIVTILETNNIEYTIENSVIGTYKIINKQSEDIPEQTTTINGNTIKTLETHIYLSLGYDYLLLSKTTSGNIPIPPNIIINAISTSLISGDPVIIPPGSSKTYGFAVILKQDVNLESFQIGKNQLQPGVVRRIAIWEGGSESLEDPIQQIYQGTITQGNDINDEWINKKIEGPTITLKKDLIYVFGVDVVSGDKLNLNSTVDLNTQYISILGGLFMSESENNPTDINSNILPPNSELPGGQNIASVGSFSFSPLN